jgi:hypothetical protein
VIHRPVIRSLADALRHGAAEWRRGDRAAVERSLRDQRLHDAGELPFIGHLWGVVLDTQGQPKRDLGLISCRVVTNAGVAFIVDSFQGLVEPEAMRFHALGTGSTAEAATQTALVTELTTQYSTANTRPQGTLGEKSGDSTTFETVATVTVSAAVGVTEHGILSQAAVGGGVLLDRSVFAVVNLGAGESLQATYQLTVPSGG